MLQIPIFHVNGEDPEAVAQVVSLAMDFRREFQKDVVIDLYAFRRWGHNEGDEPRFTQPTMYAEIDRRASVREEQYLARLLELGEISQEDAEQIQQDRTEKLESEFEASKHEPFVLIPRPSRQIGVTTLVAVNRPNPLTPLTTAIRCRCCSMP